MENRSATLAVLDCHARKAARPSRLEQANPRLGQRLMNALNLDGPLEPLSPCAAAASARVPCRRKPLAASGLRIAIQRALRRWHRTRRTWVSAFRSFRSHIQILSAREEAIADLGCGFLYDAQGRLQANTRTAARRLYTEKR